MLVGRWIVGLVLTLCALSEVSAQSTSAPRWTARVGITAEPYRQVDETTFAMLSVRAATAGPLEWKLVAGVHGVGLVRRFPVVSVAMYCPVSFGGSCLDFNDHSQLAAALMFGASMRLTNLPRALSRLIAEVGAGTYYARWTNLPSYYADRPPVFTGYRTLDVGVRVTKRVGVVAGATQFSNVRHRDDKSVARLGAELRWP